MRSVLRSLIWTDVSEKVDIEANLPGVRKNVLVNLRPEELSILDYCLEYFLKNSEAPGFSLTYDYFIKANAADELVLLDSIQQTAPYFQAEFREVFENEIEKQARDILVQQFREATDIAKTQGADPAFNFITTSAKIKPTLDDDKIPVNLKGAQDALKNLYEERENSIHRVGMKTGYPFFDEATGGIAKGQLHILAGFNGHLKSTLMMNIIVNSAVDHGWNNILFTTEMSAADVELLMAAIHSGHPFFRKKYGTTRVNAFNMLRGQLPSEEKDVLLAAIDDLTTNPHYGSIRVVDTSNFTSFNDVLSRIRQEHMKESVDIIWLDYITRLPADPAHIKLGMNAIASRNEMLLEAKRFTMQFDGGNGIAFCTPFQINREGFKEAVKNEGRMNLAHLFQYNNAEKEADTVTTVWFGEQERDLHQPKIGFLKNRFGPAPHDLCDVIIDEETRRIYPLIRNPAGMFSHPVTGSIIGTPGSSDGTPEEDIKQDDNDDGSSNV